MNPIMSKSGSQVASRLINSTAGDRTIVTYIKEKQVVYLNNVLDRKTLRNAELKDQLLSSEVRFQETSSEKTRMANLLFNEERNWRVAVEEAEKKKLQAASAFMVETAAFNAQAKHVREELKQLSFSKSESSLLEPLEKQKTKVKAAELRIRTANEEIAKLQEQGRHIEALTQQFQWARYLQLEASQKYHSIHTEWISSGKDLVRVHRLLNSVSDSNVPVEVEHKPMSKLVVLASRYLSQVGDAFAISLRH